MASPLRAPRATMVTMRIAVFLGSSPGPDSPGPDSHRAAAAELGRAIAGGGHGLVYGGAHEPARGHLAAGPPRGPLDGQSWCLMGGTSPIQRQFHRPAGETDR